MSISRIFDISVRSLAAYQQAMDVTSHNVSNSSNPDYTRQQITFTTEIPQKLRGFIWGSGVKIDQVLRVRDQLTDSQIRTYNQDYYNSTQKSEIQGQAEILFSEPSDQGISALMDSFFTSWSQLAVTPNSSALRLEVVRSAQSLASKVDSVYSGLEEIKGSLLSDANTKVNTLNNLLQQVQSLNSQIFQSTATGASPNDLMDQRDTVIDQLSQLANINVTYDESNSAVISVGGVFAADKTNFTTFKTNLVNGKMALTTSDGQFTANLTGGEIFAATDSYSNSIPGYEDKLNQIMSTMVDSVNNLHMTGYNLGDPPETGIKFFESYKDGKLVINQDIVLDPNNIAISSDGTEGNGDIALGIADLNTAQLLNGSSLADNYNSLVSEVGNNKLSADQHAAATNLVLQQLQQRKTSYSGVSIDEEMTNMIKFQRSYDASAKMITVADEMLQTVLSMVG
jgi:flagellar hook-associated protein 1